MRDNRMLRRVFRQASENYRSHGTSLGEWSRKTGDVVHWTWPRLTDVGSWAPMTEFHGNRVELARWTAYMKDLGERVGILEMQIGAPAPNAITLSEQAELHAASIAELQHTIRDN
ncbi:hypothetical protein PanWU01x14_359440 [Parasponia andersonii]|uniref:Uncharacterized protein n=1 Tax=Parasponia andersonii TaxID=3476 RepID=A0A2P5A7Y2_PARAD|nr:hypothetical protein PanWU01x14_359440 [Parasponia andersonii]